MALLGVVAIAAAFNLSCVGTTTKIPTSGEVVEQPFAQTYRVDLTSRRWCEGDCAATRPISRIEPTIITFSEGESRLGWHEHFVNRESGEMMRISGGPLGVNSVSATCQREPFSGFPSVKF